MQKAIRKLLKLPLTLALRAPFFRKRAAFHFRNEYFSDIDVSIPLSHGFWCPIAKLDAAYSFTEIFVTCEYGSFLDEVPLPCRWLDLGCHAGYFTLYLAWQHAKAGSANQWCALLIDADPRAEMLTQKTLAQNSLRRQCQFRAGLISKRSGELDFALREGTASSANTSLGGIQSMRRVSTITPAEILAALQPPYDLIKIDVEGAEADFLETYSDVYTKSTAILMEWHSYDKEGSKEESFRKLLGASGFYLVRNLRPRRVLQLGTAWLSSGTQLYRRVKRE